MKTEIDELFEDRNRIQKNIIGMISAYARKYHLLEIDGIREMSNKHRSKAISEIVRLIQSACRECQEHREGSMKRK